MTIELATIVAISGIAFSYLGYRKGVKDEAKTDGETQARLHLDIEYTKDRLDDIWLGQKDMNRKFDSFQERLIRVEESTKQAHKRLDKFDNKNKKE